MPVSDACDQFNVGVSIWSFCVAEFYDPAKIHSRGVNARWKVWTYTVPFSGLNWQKLITFETFDTSPAQSPDTFSSYHPNKRCDHCVIFPDTCGGLILKRIGLQHVVWIDFITEARPSVYDRFLIYRPLHSATFNMYKVEIFNVIGQISHYCV